MERTTRLLRRSIVVRKKTRSNLWRNKTFVRAMSNSSNNTTGNSNPIRKSEPKWSSFHVKGSGNGMKTQIQNVIPEKFAKDGGKIHTVVTDEPAKLKGTDEGTTPIHTLLAALAGCENVTAQFVAREMKIKIDKITFDIQGEMDGRGFAGVDGVYAGIQKVKVRADVETSATQEQVDQLLHQVEKRCPVNALFVKAGVEVDTKWTKTSVSPQFFNL
eukprot:TRINITY_DN1714_c0_g1_i1.p1 TRINITY_DN1714_c0_g1~~TRINITY_DN1714_c0_g1_i1.p1  ORF type:complete len:216 (+),score=58.03 TRINITY_DN1714_c0_g1_i1:9-656(+)